MSKEKRRGNREQRKPKKPKSAAADIPVDSGSKVRLAPSQSPGSAAKR